MKIILTICWLFFSWSCLANPCHKKLGVLDIGSGSTKAYAALVDTCQKRILETLFDQKISIPFKEELSRSSNNRFPSPALTKAGRKISDLVKKMRHQKVETISGIATAAFRSAANGAQAAQEISKMAKIPIQILTQEEEALVGAKAALSQLQEASQNNKHVVVWDIGGGSMQMWSESTPSQPHLFKGDLASVNFKDQIIQHIQKKDHKKVASPNPLKDQYLEAVTLAEKHALAHVPEFFRKNGSRARWLGIGGVLALSVQEQVDKNHNSFTQENLAKTLKRRSQLKDEDIDGDYHSTQISNLALVLGYMKALKLKKIETFNVSLAQGWIFHEISK